MAYGACDKCGCAYHECECPSHTEPNEEKMTTSPSPREFPIHGTYINDFRCFELAKKLGRQEAFDLLTRSEVITGEKPVSPGDYLMLNKGWAIVETNREKGYLDAVYCADGLYYLYRSGVQSFLDRIRESISWNTTLRRLYEQLTEPHEHA